VAATTDRTRSRWLPKGLAGLAGLACAACCLIPVLLAGGVIGGAGWATVGQAPASSGCHVGRCRRPAVVVGRSLQGTQCATDCGCSEHAEAV